MGERIGLLSKTVSGLVLILVLTGMLTLAFNVQPAKSEWTGTVYIRADGSIDPPDAPIITYDKVTYTLTDNITSSADGIVVERDNIIIDGAGCTLQGSGTWGSKGIDLSERSNVSIRNICVKKFLYGFFLYFSSNSNVTGNNITNNNEFGIYAYSSSNNNIVENNITNNSNGIVLAFSSDNNSVAGNNIINNKKGITLSKSSSDRLVANLFIGGSLSVYESYNNVVKDNWVNGKPVVYLENVSNIKVHDAGQVILVNCSNILIENFTLSETNLGVELWKTTNSTIIGNNITNNWNGIVLYYSSNNSVSKNNITNNSEGIYLSYSLGNRITENNITANDSVGIDLGDSSNNDINGNIITKNDYGIFLGQSLNNNIHKNAITNNWCGIDLDSSSENNNIYGNNIASNNGYGIMLGISSDNFIYHNNFINNTHQAHIYESMNVWDNGYPSGGNYWSDYVGVDVKNGPNQDLPGSDGIGDTPYVIDADNVDHYPLMFPYGAPPPPTYTLTIIATVGGTTDPAPGTYSYTENSTVEVTAIPDAGYLFDYWELDGANVGSANPLSVNINRDIILTAVFTTIPPPLSASISPMSMSLIVGEPVTFTSTTTGGYPPYGYQWYLNGNPVSGAASNTWTFTPTTSGIYYVYLKVTDDKGNTAQSDTARITVSAVPVGGYSIPINVPTTTTKPITPYITLLAILTTIFTTIKRKTKRKH